MSNIHPDIEHMLGSILRMPAAKSGRYPCELCAEADICEVYPCPKIGPEDIDVPEGAED
jgi:hypothetical protein